MKFKLFLFLFALCFVAQRSVADPAPIVIDQVPVFCFRWVLIECLDFGVNCFRLTFEVLNWADRPVFGVELNQAQASQVGFWGASVTNDVPPPPGNLSPFNNFTVTNQTVSRIVFTAPPTDPIPNFDLLAASPTNPPWIGNPPPPTGTVELVDNGFNVLRGFSIVVCNWTPGKVLAFAWRLLDLQGVPLTNVYGFGVVNVVRGAAPRSAWFPFNAGFSASLNLFAPNPFLSRVLADVPVSESEPRVACTNTTFSSEFGAGAQVAEDPHLVNFLGQKFDFMGHPGKVYNLISDQHFLVNSKFVGWHTEGYSKQWTFLGDVGIRLDDNTIIYNAEQRSLVINDQIFSLSQPMERSFDNGFINCAHRICRIDTHYGWHMIITPKTSNHIIHYVNLDFERSIIKNNADGVIGQSANGRYLPLSEEQSCNDEIFGGCYVHGSPEDYEVVSGDILGYDCSVNRYQPS